MSSNAVCYVCVSFGNLDLMTQSCCDAWLVLEVAGRGTVTLYKVTGHILRALLLLIISLNQP